MKKFFVFAIAILIAVAGVIQFSGGVSTDPTQLTLAEAQFSARSQKTTDSTQFLVGKFLCEDGSKLAFDGSGCVTRIGQNLQPTEGEYSLTQAEDGASVLWLDLGGGRVFYTFRLASPEGEIVLLDAANIEHVLTPVE